MAFLGALLEVVREDMREKLTLIMLRWRNRAYSDRGRLWPRVEGALYHMFLSRQFERHLTLYSCSEENLWEGMATMASMEQTISNWLVSPDRLLTCILANPMPIQQMARKLRRDRPVSGTKCW